MGYSLWDELIAGVAQEFAPALTRSGDYLGDVDRIAAAESDAGREDEYFKCLDGAFCVDVLWKLFLRRYTVTHVRQEPRSGLS